MTQDRFRGWVVGLIAALLACDPEASGPGGGRGMDAGITDAGVSDAGGQGTLAGALAFTPLSVFVYYRGTADAPDLTQRYVTLAAADLRAYCAGAGEAPTEPYEAVSLYVQAEIDGGQIVQLQDHWPLHRGITEDGGTRLREGSFSAFTLTNGTADRTSGSFAVGHWYASDGTPVAATDEAGLSLSGTFDAVPCPPMYVP